MNLSFKGGRVFFVEGANRRGLKFEVGVNGYIARTTYGRFGVLRFILHKMATSVKYIINSKKTLSNFTFNCMILAHKAVHFVNWPTVNCK